MYIGPTMISTNFICI